MPTIQQLQVFVNIADAGTLTGAARRMGYKASAGVSFALQRLEDEVGTRLVDRARGPGTSTLTEAGEQFLPAARRAVNAYFNGLLRIGRTSVTPNTKDVSHV